MEYKKEPGNCDLCGRKLTKWVNRSYVYYVCHPCRHEQNPDLLKTTRVYNFRKRGVSEEWYYATLESQGNVCAICKRPETATQRGRVRLYNIDHNHSCCKWGCERCVRGLLCTQCNKGIGNLREDLGILNSAISYLQQYKLEDIPENQ